MNASLIEEFHLQFQRLVEELKQSLTKELENKAAELYTLFLYHLSAAYSPVGGHLQNGNNRLLQHHQLPSSLVSPLASPLAQGPGPRGGGSLVNSSLHHGLHHQQSFINTHSPIRNNPHHHSPQQSTFFFRAPPHSLHSGSQSSNTSFNNSVAANGGGPSFFPVPGPPVMIEFAENSRRNQILSHQHHQQQLRQLQHQSLGAITKVTSAINGLPHHQNQQHPHQSVRAPPPPPLPPLPQVNHISRPSIPPILPPQVVQPLPIRPIVQRAPTVTAPPTRSVNLSSELPSPSSTKNVTPQVVMPVVQNPPALQISNLITQSSLAAKTLDQVSQKKVLTTPPPLSLVEENSEPSKKASEQLPPTTQPSSSPQFSNSPPQSPSPPSPFNTSETEKDGTTSTSLSTKTQTSPSPSSPTTEKELLLTKKNTSTAKSVEPMDLSRNSPTTITVKTDKKEPKSENKSDSSDDNKNENTKCNCKKCKNKEVRLNQGNGNDDDDDENDDDIDDEEDEDDNEDNENVDEGDEEEELEDEDVQVVSEDDEELFFEEVEETKKILKNVEKQFGSNSDENNDELVINLSDSSIPVKRLKPNQPNSPTYQKDQTNSENEGETLSSQTKATNQKFLSLRRSFSLDLTTKTTTDDTNFLEKSITLSSSSSELTQPLETFVFKEFKKVNNNNNDNSNKDKKKNNETVVNGGGKRKLDSPSPVAEVQQGQAQPLSAPAAIQLPLPLGPYPESPLDVSDSYTESMTSDQAKVRHFQTLSVKCLLDDCPATFEKLESLDEHLIEHHCILPHRCVMQGCTLSFSSTYELGRHYRIDHQGDGVKVWQCSKCGMKSKGNHYLLKHMYNYHYEGVFQCAKFDCPYQAKYRQQVVNHYRRHHLPVPERFDLVTPKVTSAVSQGMLTQQCPLEACRATIRSGELPLRRHLDQAHNGFALGAHLTSNASLRLAKDIQLQQQQQQMFFRSVTDSTTSMPSTSTSLLNFERGQHAFPQHQREYAIASVAAAAAAAEIAAAAAASAAASSSTSVTLSKYANERNATTYNIISVNCTVEGCCTAAAAAMPMRSVEELECHLEAVHGILPFCCYLCTLSFSIVRDLDVHLLEAHLGQIEWPCPRCDHKRKSHHALANHVLKFHHSGAFACPAPGCGHISGLRIEAIRHYNRLHCEYACKVDGCGRIFKAKDCLRAHEAADHSNRGGGGEGDGNDSDHHHSGAFTCNTCGKPFSTKGNLKTHQRIHLGVKPFRCRFNGCGKAFRAKEHLTIHERTHSGIKPYRCTWPECGHQTTDRSSMIAHVRGFHFRLPYKLKEQKERNIVDDRDPRQFVEVLPELLKYESFIHVFTG